MVAARRKTENRSGASMPSVLEFIDAGDEDGNFWGDMQSVETKHRIQYCTHSHPFQCCQKSSQMPSLAGFVRP
jgi:hypothetical protein